MLVGMAWKWVVPVIPVFMVFVAVKIGGAATENCTVFPNTDFNGWDMPSGGAKHGISDPGECCQLCIDTASCR